MPACCVVYASRDLLSFLNSQFFPLKLWFHTIGYFQLLWLIFSKKILVAGREVDVIGIFRYRNTWPLCIEFLKAGKIDVKPLITHRFGFSQQEVEDAFETSARGGTAIKVMFNL